MPAFGAAVQGHREAVAPVVVQLLQSASEACPPGAAAQLAAAAQQQQQQNGAAAGGRALVRGIPAAVLSKEAVYQAVAAGAYELHDYVDFTGPSCLLFPAFLIPQKSFSFERINSCASPCRPCVSAARLNACCPCSRLLTPCMQP